MISLVSKKIFLFCSLFIINSATAKKDCPSCNTVKTSDKNIIKNKDLDNKLTQLIKAAFQAKKVEFSIPKKMEAEFNAKKKALINDFDQKMSRAKTDFVNLSSVKAIVDQAFEFFIDRVKYAQKSAEFHAVLSSIVKDPNKPNSSSIFSNKSFRNLNKKS